MSAYEVETTVDQAANAGVKRPRQPTRAVLVIGDDTQSFLAIVRSLGRKGLAVHAAPFNWRAPALRSRYIAKSHRLPRVEPDTGAWIEAVAGLAAEYDYDLIIPCSERALLPLWEHRERFRPGQIANPGPAAMRCLFDKLETRRLAIACGVPVAPGRALAPDDTGAGLVSEFGSPIFIKSRNSYTIANLSARGEVKGASSAAEADAILSGIADRSGFFVEAAFPAGGRGSGIGVSVLASAGEVLAAFQHRRLREKPGGGASSVRISEALDPALLAACRSMAEASRLEGVAMFEFRFDDESGKWVLLEVNARFWGSVALPIAAGLDFPAKLYDLMVTGKLEVATDYRVDVLSSNAVQAIRHVIADETIAAGRKPLLVLREVLGRAWNWLGGKEAVDEFAADDVVPGIAAHLSALPRLRERALWEQDGTPERRGIAGGRGKERAGARFAAFWARDSVKTLLARVGGVGAGFLLNVLLARMLDTVQFGTYAAIWTWVVVLGALAPLGFSLSATRYVASYSETGAPGHVRGFLRLAGAFVLAASLAFAGLMGLGALLSGAWGVAAFAGAAALPFFALTEFGKGVARGAGWQLLAYAPGYVVRPVLLLFGLSALWFAGTSLTAAGALLVTLAATAAAALAQWGMIGRRLRGLLGRAPLGWDVKEWVGVSLPLVLVESYTLFLSFGDIIILQFLVPMHEVALYYVAAKIAAVVAFIHIAVSSTAGRPIAAAFARGDNEAIRKLTRKFIAEAFWPSLAIAALLAVFGGRALALFGPSYETAWPILMLLVSGLLVQAATGPLKFILSMTGGQAAVARVVLGTMLANLVLNIGLVLAFGTIGAAIATALVTALGCGLMMLQVRRRLGFWSVLGAVAPM